LILETHFFLWCAAQVIWSGKISRWITLSTA